MTRPLPARAAHAPRNEAPARVPVQPVLGRNGARNDGIAGRSAIAAAVGGRPAGVVDDHRRGPSACAVRRDVEPRGRSGFL